MTFDEIIRRWEESETGAGTAGRTSQESGREDLSRLIDLYPPAGRKKEDDETCLRTSPDERTSLRQMKIDDTLDLHSLSAREAQEALEAFIRTALGKGFRKVLIIHGKGHHSSGRHPVLKQVVMEYLEKCPHAGRTGTPGRNEGGSGAVWVMIKNGPGQRSR